MNCPHEFIWETGEEYMDSVVDTNIKIGRLSPGMVLTEFIVSLSGPCVLKLM